jgi:hypothetical protein
LGLVPAGPGPHLIYILIFFSLFIRQRRDSDPNVDAPSLDFEYADSDLYFSELSELYSYSEVPEFQNTIELFHVSLESVFGAGVGAWRKLGTGQRKDFIMVMLDRFEVRTLPRIAGNFQGRNLSRIRGLEPPPPHPESFSPRNYRHATPTYKHSMKLHYTCISHKSVPCCLTTVGC